MDSALSPREIQSRIRSGASLDDVAAEAGVPVDQVEPFAVPVLAELEHIVETALDCPVRRHADPGAHRSLRTVVGQVCGSHGIDEADLHWRCWRHQDRSWAVLATWQGEPGPGEGEATFRFDPRGRYSSPQDAGARWLVDDRGPVSRPKAGPANPDEEPTIDLHDELAIVRAVADRPQRGAGRAGRRPDTEPPRSQPDDAHRADGADHPLPALPGMTETNGVYDFAPSTDQQMDTLYEMLAGSRRIRSTSIRAWRIRRWFPRPQIPTLETPIPRPIRRRRSHLPRPTPRTRRRLGGTPTRPLPPGGGPRSPSSTSRTPRTPSPGRADGVARSPAAASGHRCRVGTRSCSAVPPRTSEAQPSEIRGLTRRVPRWSASAPGWSSRRG
ncbi:MAG: septation protein SepH [Acidipropionibacterium sp.]|nr:septation protein SepH [Acidipropionibacterium sp.]